MLFNKELINATLAIFIEDCLAKDNGDLSCVHTTEFVVLRWYAAAGAMQHSQEEMRNMT